MRIRKSHSLNKYFLEVFDNEIMTLNNHIFFQEVSSIIDILTKPGNRKYSEDVETCENSSIVCEFRCTKELAEHFPEWFI